MNNMNQFKTPTQKKSGSDDFLKTIQDFFTKMSDQDKIAYGLIALGVVFIIIGVVLW
jgi:flagellar biosynthesis/type III secretory pathway M-ring protein FliF/YscJ